MGDWKKKLVQAYQAWLGNALAIFALLSMMTQISREAGVVLKVWNKPPLTAFPAYHLLLLLIPLGLALIIFHVPMGESRGVRIITGILGLVDLYFISLAFFMSWSAAVFYHPIVKMNLDDLGGAGYAAQIGQGALALPILLIFGVYAVLVYSVAHVTNFWDQFFHWRLEGLLAGFGTRSELSNDESTDVVLCIDEKTKKSVLWREVDQPTNMGIIGPVGSGKTTMVIVPVLAQFLLNGRVGVVCVEPKGDLVSQLAELNQKSGRKYVFINPGEPNCPVFNPLEGDDPDIVAEVNKNALAAQFGQQDPFFSKNQAVAAKNMILLLKYLRGNNCTYADLTRCLEDDKETQNMVNELERRLPSTLDNDDSRVMLLHWFKNEYFGENAKEIKRFTLGLRIQIEEMLGNSYFKRITCGRSTFNMYDAIENGYDLFVSTNDGILGDKLSSMLGILIMQHYQAAIQKRGTLPPAGEARRKYKLSVCALDEFGGYVNAEFPKFLSKARGYGAIMILAMHNTSQLLRVGGTNNTGFRDDVLTNLRSMVIYGGINVSDAKYFSETFGKQEEEVVSSSTSVSRGKYSWFVPDSSNDGSRSQIMDKEIYTATEIMYLPANRIYYRMMLNRSLQKPGIGLVDWFTREKSNIGNVYWFDIEEFDKRLEERQQKLNPTKGFWGSIGINFGQSKAKQKEVREMKGADSMMQESEELKTELVYIPPERSSDSAFRFSEEVEEVGVQTAAMKKEAINSIGEWGGSSFLKPTPVRHEGELERQKDDSFKSQLAGLGWDISTPLVIPRNESNPEQPQELQRLEELPNNADDILNDF